MLAVQAPGAKMDIAPERMVSDATAYSKTEHQRDERVAAAAKRNSGGGRGGDGGNRGGGRGGNRGGNRGGGAAGGRGGGRGGRA